MLLPFLLYLKAALPFGLDFRPPGDVTQYVPTRAKLTASPTLGATFDSYGLELRVAYGDLDSANLIAKVQRARSLATAMASSPVKPIDGLPQNAPGRFDDRLLLDVSNSTPNGTQLGFDLASGATSPAGITDKVAALLQMRRVSDVFIRIAAAQQAATKLRRPIEELMTLYRVEGNLDVPPSSGSLDRLIPSDAPTAPTKMGSYQQPDGSLIWPHLVWLGKSPFKYGIEIFEQGTSDPKDLKEPAILDWALQICGLDDLQSLYFSKGSGTMKDEFARWSNDNWTAAGLASTPSEAEQRWDALVSNLVTREVAPAAGVVSVAPSDPADFVAGLLVEAQALLLADRNAITAGPLDMPMKYLIYHAGTEQFSQLMTRALLEVHATSPAAYRPLRDEIRSDTSFTAKLDSLKPQRSLPDTPALRLALDVVSPDTNAWLAAKNPARIQMLSAFLETASATVWNSWTEHRGNLSRYMVLLEYYRRVFA